MFHTTVIAYCYCSYLELFILARATVLLAGWTQAKAVSTVNLRRITIYHVLAKSKIKLMASCCERRFTKLIFFSLSLISKREICRERVNIRQLGNPCLKRKHSSLILCVRDRKLEEGVNLKKYEHIRFAPHNME